MWKTWWDHLSPFLKLLFGICILNLKNNSFNGIGTHFLVIPDLFQMSILIENYVCNISAGLILGGKTALHPSSPYYLNK